MKRDRTEYSRAYYVENREAILTRNKAYYLKKRERIIARQREWQKENEAKTQTYRKASRQKLRAELIAAYGGVCKCCGESCIGFLTVDHINNDGRADRNRFGSPIEIYRNLRLQGWPSHVRLLCYNCNCGREKNGGVCPHEAEFADAFALAGVC